MGLASVVHPGMPCVSPPSNCSRLQLTHHHIFSLRTVGHGRRAEYFPIACSRGTEQEDHFSPSDCSRGTEQEDHFSTSERKRIGSQSYDEIFNADPDNTPDAINNLEKSQGHETYASSVRNVSFWVCAAVAFGIGLGFKDGLGKASEFFAGYILEQSLSVDNLFVFVLIFKYFKVPFMYQNRVLSYGIAGAVVFRLTLILLGAATLQRFEAVNLLLAAILLFSSFKLFSSEEGDTDLSDNFVVKTCQRFIPVTTNYDSDRFITVQNDVWKVSNILGRPHLCFSQWQLLSSVT